MIRRIVTGHRNGLAAVLSDGPVPNTHDFTSIAGFQTSLVWSAPAIPSIPHDGSDPTAKFISMLPTPHGSTFIIARFPPDSVMMAADFDGAAAGREQLEYLPGLAETFDADGSGFHTTPTVDYDIILEGEIWLELDDGEERHIKAGDIVIQNGTHHAWRNRSDKPCTMASILIGAQWNP